MGSPNSPFSGPAEVGTLVRAVWRGRESPAISDVLTPAVLADQDALSDAVAADVELRREHGLPSRIEDYLAAVPSLVNSPPACRAVLMAEVAARAGESLEAIGADLRARTPALAGEVDAVIELSALLRDAAAEAMPIRERGTRLGKYELLELLGQGSFGETWHALDTRLQRHVALKLLLAAGLPGDRGVKAVLNEARAAAALEHESVVRVHEAGELPESGEYFIDTQLVKAGEGEPGTLEDLLRRGPVATARAARLIAAVGRGLAAAHSRGLVHRDVKPANILLAAGDRPMIADFGLSVWADPGGTRAVALRVAGTPAYMAPEVARGEGATPASDVFALGATLRALLTGAAPRTPPRPGEGDSAGQVMDLARSTPIPPVRGALPDLDRTLAAIADRATAYRVEDRYATAERLADDLEAWLSRRVTQARPLGPVGTLVLWHRRNLALSLLGLAATLLIVGGTAVFVARLTVERNRAVAAEREADRKRDEAVRAREVIETMNAFMTRVFTGARAIERGPEFTVADAIRLASDRAGLTFSQRPEVEAAVRHFLGQAALGSGDRGRAIRELARAHDLRKHALGPRHPDTVASARQIAEWMAQSDLLPEAMVIHSLVVNALSEPEGRQGLDTLRSRSALAVDLLRRGDVAVARALMEAIVAEYRLLDTNVSGEQTALMAQLVSVYEVLREPDLSEATQREIIAINTRDLGPDDVSTLNSTQALGQLLRRHGKPGEARALYRDVLPRYERTAGEQYSGWQLVALELALLEAESDPPAALALARRITAMTDGFSESHQYRLRGRTALGAALEATGDLPGARESLRAAFEGNLKHRGATHAHTREAGVIYARVLSALGEEAEAARVRRAAGIR